jgi:hypothetical protein
MKKSRGSLINLPREEVSSNLVRRSSNGRLGMNQREIWRGSRSSPAAQTGGLHGRRELLAGAPREHDFLEPMAKGKHGEGEGTFAGSAKPSTGSDVGWRWRTSCTAAGGSFCIFGEVQRRTESTRIQGEALGRFVNTSRIPATGCSKRRDGGRSNRLRRPELELRDDAAARTKKAAAANRWKR